MTLWCLQTLVRATLLFGALAACWRWLPADRPAFRRAVVLTVASLALVLPWLPGWWAVAVPTTSADSAAGLSAVEAPAAGVPWLALLWATGAGAAVVRWTVQTVRLRRLLAGARPAQTPVPTSLHVLVSSEVSGPCVAGVRSPVLLVPEHSAAWTDDAWRMVLAHEAQHVAQRDLPAAWLLRVTLAVYWWHPLAHWLERQFHLESEALCDRAAAPASTHVRSYVDFLLALDARRLPAQVAAMGRPSRLRERVARLVAGPSPRSSAAARVAALACVAAACGAGALWKCSPAPPVDAPPVDDTALRLSADPFPGDP